MINLVIKSFATMFGITLAVDVATILLARAFHFEYAYGAIPETLAYFATGWYIGRSFEGPGVAMWGIGIAVLLELKITGEIAFLIGPGRTPPGPHPYLALAGVLANVVAIFIAGLGVWFGRATTRRRTASA